MVDASGPRDGAWRTRGWDLRRSRGFQTPTGDPNFESALKKKASAAAEEGVGGAVAGAALEGAGSLAKSGAQLVGRARGKELNSVAEEFRGRGAEAVGAARTAEEARAAEAARKAAEAAGQLPKVEKELGRTGKAIESIKGRAPDRLTGEPGLPSREEKRAVAGWNTDVPKAAPAAPNAASGGVDPHKFMGAYDKLKSAQGGFSAVTIYDLARELNVPVKDLHEFLRAAGKAGDVNLHPTTSVNMPKEVTDAALHIEGHEPFITTELSEQGRAKFAQAPSETKASTPRDRDAAALEKLRAPRGEAPAPQNADLRAGVVERVRNRARQAEKFAQERGMKAEEAKAFVQEQQTRLEDTERAADELAADLSKTPRMNKVELGDKVQSQVSKMVEKLEETRSKESGFTEALRDSDGKGYIVGTAPIRAKITQLKQDAARSRAKGHS